MNIKLLILLLIAIANCTKNCYCSTFSKFANSSLEEKLNHDKNTTIKTFTNNLEKVENIDKEDSKLSYNSSDKSLRRRIRPTDDESRLETQIKGQTKALVPSDPVNISSHIKANSTTASIVKTNISSVIPNSKETFNLPKPTKIIPLNLTNPFRESQGKNVTSTTPLPIQLPVDALNRTEIHVPIATTSSPNTTKSVLKIKTSSSTTTTTTTRPKKPKVTYGTEDFPNIDKKLPESTLSTSKLPIQEVEGPKAQPSQEDYKKSSNGFPYYTHRNYYFMPSVAIMCIIPILMGTAIVVYRRFRDFWSTRHYRRMDFLVDVSTQDFDYPEFEMDDRDSLYFDTISLAGSEAAAVVAAAAHRRSLSQSRMTIYHSAVDLANDGTPSKRNSRIENGNGSRAFNWIPQHRHSTGLNPSTTKYENATTQLMGVDDRIGTNKNFTDAVDNDQRTGRSTEEISRRLLHNNSMKDKKSPITYSQWKSRTRRRFQDGIRSVDFVLAYNGDDNKAENKRKREHFESNLVKEGLHLERDNTQRVHFVKLHAPLEVLCRYSEILKIKMPMKKIQGQDFIIDKSFEVEETIRGCCGRLFSSVQLDPEKFPSREYRLYCEFSRNYLHLFEWEKPNFFDAGIRNSIIYYILERVHFVEEIGTPDDLGIDKLIADGVYDCAYTLHDDTDRDLLLDEWAVVKKWKNLQPLDNIKEYFGPKVALYFAWLGFYTHMLIPVSIIGILCFMYGLITWSTDPISTEICNTNKTTLMCPQCDTCNFWELQKTCSYSKMNYLIDNNVTCIFAFVMSVWAVLYLEMWKRYSAELIHRWGMTGFSQQCEHPRPQYLARLRKKAGITEKLNVLNNILEPDIPFWRTKFLSDFTSYSIMILFICLSIIAIFSLIVYRMARKTSARILGESIITSKIMLQPMTAGIIDLIVISLLDYAYSYLAVYLTNIEYRRTQTEYDESLTIKNYLFQFVNYYSCLFYIAFLKGKFVGYPAKYNKIFGFRQEECNQGGCLMELCIQLVIIMVGKQAVGALIEMTIPYVTKTWNKLSVRMGWRHRANEDKLVSCNQWTEDYHLIPWTHSSLYVEYLEMVLQFGFITLFGLAFPLAPLLALLNNVVEVRLDAIKMLNFYRRPVAQRARNIGVWYNMMSITSKIAVVSSAVIIAFSTNLIPKLIYRSETHDETLVDYLNFTLAHFNTEDFQDPLEKSVLGNVTTCRYPEFRNPPWDAKPYKRPIVYWKILTARLAFIVIFQNIIGVIQAVVAWSIPDVPGKLRKQIKREEILVRETIIEYEKKIAAELAAEVQTATSDGGGDQSSAPIPLIPQQINLPKQSTATNSGGIDDELLRRRYNSSQDGAYDRTTPV